MKKTSLNYIILLFLLTFINKLHAQKPIKIYADPETTPGIKASKFINGIDFIPLETTNLSKYKSAQWKIITKSKFIIFDNTSQTFYFFDKVTGKYLHKFKNEESRYKVNSVQYVPGKNAILVISKNKHYSISHNKALQLIKRWEGKDISKYVSLQWIYLDKAFKHEKMYAPSIALNNNITYFQDGFIYRNYSYDKYSKDSILYRIVKYDSTNHVKSTYFPFINLPGLWSYYQSYMLPLPSSSIQNDSMMLFQLDFNPSVYELRKDTIIEKYKFILPISNLMPANFNSLTFKSNIDYEKYKEKNAKALFYYYSLLKQGKYLFFGTTTLGSKSKSYVLFDHTLHDLSKLTTDSSIHNLSPGFFDYYNTQDKEYLYVTITAEKILEQKKNLLSDINVSKKFKKHLRQMTKDDNSILVRIKLK